MHTIEIDLSTLGCVSQYICEELDNLTKAGFNISMLNVPIIYCDDELQQFPVEGYMDPDTKEIAIACGKPFEHWFPIFVHECCHVDQCTEQVYEWTQNNVDGIDATQAFDDWISYKRELTLYDAFKYCFCIQILERDCERRTLEKITKFNLPIDCTLYTQQANAYLLFYSVATFCRRWANVSPPWASVDIVSLMPTTLLPLHMFNVTAMEFYDKFLPYLTDNYQREDAMSPLNAVKN